MNPKTTIALIILISINLNLYAANIVVNSSSGSVTASDDGFCTLHEAVESANSNTASGQLIGECIAGESLPTIDTITFASSILPATIHLELPIQLSESVNLSGPHKELLTLSSIGLDRVLKVSNLTPADFMIEKLTISGGFTGVGSLPVGVGGGMLVSLANSSLTIDRVYFTNNSAEYAGGALGIAYGGTSNNTVTIENCEFDNNNTIGSTANSGNVAGGGAIFIGAFQNVTINNSTFYDNHAINNIALNPTAPAQGGAILMLSSSSVAVSELTIDSSTFDENTAYGVGGAISIGGANFVDDYSIVNIKHSTITRNESNPIMTDQGSGGGIYTSTVTPVNIFNTIVSTNVDYSTTTNYPNISGDFNTLGHNFINFSQTHSSIFPLGMPNINNDLVGTSVALPKLNPLASNGGSTLTRSLQDDSPLIDQGKCTNIITDQRGYFDIFNQVRRVDRAEANLADGCDIGAYEKEAIESNSFPQANNDSFDILEDGSIDLFDNLNVLDNDNDPEGDTLVVINAGLVATNSSTIPNPGNVDLWSNGDFTYTPPADEFGIVDFRYIISDGNTNVGADVFINVLPVNDAPSFNHGFTTISFAGTNSIAGVHEYENWATNISTGPANESSQSYQFQIQTFGDTSIFANTPTISPTGTLCIELAENALGTATISVKLKDNGGTSNGGIDESAEVIIQVYANLDLIFSDSFENNGNS
ncbi:MAG: choice-of-anchor Q domain-containing protein [Gammaproteobacteria bacterium]|nr:cadherin-like domain-containing protein [Xanthomonadales bacterium]